MYFFIKETWDPKIPFPYKGILHYIKKSMKDLSEISHGDIVIERRGVELLRVKGNYKINKLYSADYEQKNKQENKEEKTGSQ